MMTESSYQRPHSSIQLFGWYLLFGAVHEVSHALGAWWFLGVSSEWNKTSSFLNMLLGRSFCLSASMDGHNESALSTVRHAGWIGSVVVFLLCLVLRDRYASSNKNRVISPMILASFVTVLEALSTDLLQFRPLLPLVAKSSPAAAVVFYCGNFGVILLHPAWHNNKQRDPWKAALDTVQQMVTVTMMRGAQTSGVVVYHSHQQPQDKNGVLSLPHTRAVRSRVVNKKRTDLSQLIRSKLQQDLRSSRFPQTFCPIIAGHTRFATSSLSTLEGTHPHIWTPPSPRRMQNIHGATIERPTTVTVENYITHNGDFDFFSTKCGKTFDLEAIQDFLRVVTHHEGASVDSAAIAGLVDILRCQGCWGLAARYAVVLGMDSTSDMSLYTRFKTQKASSSKFPSYDYWQNVIGRVFEDILEVYGAENNIQSLQELGGKPQARTDLAKAGMKCLLALPHEKLHPLLKLVNQNGITHDLPVIVDETTKNDGQQDGVVDDLESNPHDGLQTFCQVTVDAFLDNDLFFTTKHFLKHAKGSFGLSVTSNLDSHRQMCLAARGQTISVAFYPDKGLICYGSEQAAVKAGLNAVFPGTPLGSQSNLDIDNASTRLDLDDLGGEIILLDWGQTQYPTPPVSWPNRHLEHVHLMDDKVTVVLHQESKSTKTDSQIYHRMTKLSGNPLIRPLPEALDIDPILADIHDIPQVCKKIQEDWHSRKAATSLNRLTAFNFSRCLRRRLEQHCKGTVPPLSLDILVTGCEVSLWLAEQFAADLKKCFPKLAIEAVSSNKILGLFGQEIEVPSLGFPYTPHTRNLHDSIVIIVSHSGGTFSPLACSNLLQSTTRNIFVVTSEWDTQIGKQLRQMDENDGTGTQMLDQRIFSTEVGMRPAEPCSVSVVATHQLLTNLLEYTSAFILSDARFRRATNAQITEQDLQILETCNRMNINALTEIVGVNSRGYKLDSMSSIQRHLRVVGDLWSDHILENARAYIMCAVYIFVTVTSGWPLVTAIGRAAGAEEKWFYLIRFFDSCIYFWLPQICITIIRLFQGRNLLHRMTGRTVVIGDIPWVSQCADAFLSKIFAVSYSIAGLNVLSGNPADHFVHRHTHRVVRGTLAIFGRPDGRLSALSTAEASVCLSCNQASSIQSRGGTCESITLGHNPFKLPLSHAAIALKRHRPLFLCERLLVESDADHEKKAREAESAVNEDLDASSRRGIVHRVKSSFRFTSKPDVMHADMSIHAMLDCSISVKIHKNTRSAPALLGAYLNIDEEKSANLRIRDDETEESLTVDDVVAEAIQQKHRKRGLHRLFTKLDQDKDGLLDENDFTKGAMAIDPSLSETQVRLMFENADVDGSGKIDYNDFCAFLQTSGYDQYIKVPPSNRDDRGLIQIEVTKEKYFGETVRRYNAGKNDNSDMDFVLAKQQHLVQELYETRVASMQRFVALCVLFHHMGKQVERFFATISFGWWAYRMDRTHSIVRIATTASPVSGSDVRQRMERLRLWKRVLHSVQVIEAAYMAHRKHKEKRQVEDLVRKASSISLNAMDEKKVEELVRQASSINLHAMDGNVTF